MTSMTFGVIVALPTSKEPAFLTSMTNAEAEVAHAPLTVLPPRFFLCQTDFGFQTLFFTFF